MLSVVRNSKGEVVFMSNEPLNVENIMVAKELETFNPDEFIQSVRQQQEKEKERNKQRYAVLKEKVVGKGYELKDSGFLPEYTKDYCYGGSSGSVLTLKKENLVIDIWANGEQRYTVFDDEAFCWLLHYEGVEKGRISKDTEELIRKGIYYCMKLALDGVFPRYEFNPVEQLICGEWFPFLSKEARMFLASLEEHHYEEIYVNEDMLPDRLPVGWYAGCYRCEENNWIEVFFDWVEGEETVQLNDGHVYGSDDFLDALEDIDDLYLMGMQYKSDLL